MALRVKEIVKMIESMAPKEYAMEWDNVGIQIGSENKEVKHILIALEINEDVLKMGEENGIDLIITHHPLLFKGLKSINFDTYQGSLLHRAIRDDLHIYSCHTNIDVAPEGLNQNMAEKIGLKNIEVMAVEDRKPYVKFAVYVPQDDVEKVADAISKGGGGVIGNYSHCTFRTAGKGTFLPGEGANPSIGEKGSMEYVDEVKLETIVPKKDLHRVIQQVKDAHPYEEVAFDVLSLENIDQRAGLGRRGVLEEPLLLSDWIKRLKDRLRIDSIKVSGNLDHRIQSVGILNGSGADYIPLAIQQGLDCFITGDVKYHDAQNAMDADLDILDIGHYESEIFFVDFLADFLEENLKEHNQGLEENEQIRIHRDRTLPNPFKTL